MQHRLRKLNALAKGGSTSATTMPANTNGNEDSAPDTPTPSPRKRAPANGTKPATPGRKRRAETKEDVNDEEVPAKKVKGDVNDDCA